MSLVVMLAVLWMLIQRASDPDVWLWLANDNARPAGKDAKDANSLEDQSPEVTPTGSKAVDKAKAVKWVETVIPGPNDLDEEEIEGAQEQYQAITDRAALGPEEMPAYWRLVRWSRTESFKSLRQRAKRGVFFTQLGEQPEKYRGKLIELKMHVKQVIKHDEVPINSAKVDTLYEARGRTDESQSFPYVVVFSELPPNMPLGHDLYEEAVFVGYFFKTWTYEDAMGTARWAPMLIGRLEWRENVASVQLARQRTERGYFWPTMAIGAVVVLAIVGSWIWGRGKSRVRLEPAVTEEQQQAVAEWLSDADQPAPAEPPPPLPGGYANGHTNGFAGGGKTSGSVDWTDDDLSR